MLMERSVCEYGHAGAILSCRQGVVRAVHIGALETMDEKENRRRTNQMDREQSWVAERPEKWCECENDREPDNGKRSAEKEKRECNDAGERSAEIGRIAAQRAPCIAELLQPRSDEVPQRDKDGRGQHEECEDRNADALHDTRVRQIEVEHPEMLRRRLLRERESAQPDRCRSEDEKQRREHPDRNAPFCEETSDAQA